MANELGKYLRSLRGTMTLREFAAKCTISHTHLDSIEKGVDPRTKKPVSISVETLRLIADGLGEDFLHLAYLAAGRDPAEWAKPTHKPTSSNSEPSLAPDEQKLLDDYRSLNDQGREYIRQTMHMATQTYKKMDRVSGVEGLA